MEKSTVNVHIDHIAYTGSASNFKLIALGAVGGAVLFDGALSSTTNALTTVNANDDITFAVGGLSTVGIGGIVFILILIVVQHLVATSLSHRQSTESLHRTLRFHHPRNAAIGSAVNAGSGVVTFTSGCEGFEIGSSTVGNSVGRPGALKIDRSELEFITSGDLNFITATGFAIDVYAIDNVIYTATISGLVSLGTSGFLAGVVTFEEAAVWSYQFQSKRCAHFRPR